MTEQLLDCGHPESPHSELTTGYGTDSDGRRHCYDCCLARDLAYMSEHGKLSAYLSGDGKSITTWPGGKLADVIDLWQTSAGGFLCGVKIARVRARSVSGEMWHGRGPGRGMYIRMTKTKTK